MLALVGVRLFGIHKIFQFKDAGSKTVHFYQLNTHVIPETNCITLVIVPVARYVRTLWTPMLTNDIDTAKKKIAEREGIRIEENITKYIAHLNVNGSFDGKDPIANIIGRWASSLGLDAVVWTNLPPKFNGEVGRIPTVEEVISFLNIQSSETKKRAEEYIRRSPLQIDTEYRRRIEAELNWTPLSDI